MVGFAEFEITENGGRRRRRPDDETPPFPTGMSFSSRVPVPVTMMMRPPSRFTSKIHDIREAHPTFAAAQSLRLLALVRREEEVCNPMY